MKKALAAAIASAALLTGVVAAAPSATAASTIPTGSTAVTTQVPTDYSWKSGRLMYNPPRSICTKFNCINNFWNGRGYVVQCRDGMIGKSGGIQGSCSWHGGNSRPIYWK